MSIILTALSSYGINLAAGISFDIRKGVLNNLINVDKKLGKAIKEAMNKAIKDWCPVNETIRADKSGYLKEKITQLVEDIDSLEENIKKHPELDTFFVQFDKIIVLPKYEIAYKYLSRIASKQDFLEVTGKLDTIEEKIDKGFASIGSKLDGIKLEKDDLTIPTLKQAVFRIKNYGFESYGREQQKKQLLEFYNSPNKHFIFVYGSGGMGKTHLVSDVIKKLNKTPIYFKADKNTSIEDLYAHCFSEGDVYTIKDKNELARRFDKQYESSGLNLIIDDFYEIFDSNLRELIIRLRDIRNGKLLLISRSLQQEFKEYTTVKVERIDDNSMREYIKRRYENDHELQANLVLNESFLNELVAILKGYPLGLTFIFDRYKNPIVKNSILAEIKQCVADKDDDGKIFMGRLLRSVIAHGKPEEMQLLTQLSVFIKPVHKSVVAKFPAFISNTTFSALIRKDFVWTLGDGFIELHALVRELLYDENENIEDLNIIAAEFYEDIALKSNMDDMESFKTALYHSERGGDKYLQAFKKRQEELFGSSKKIKSFINENYLSSIERLKYRIELYPQQNDAYNELAILYISKFEYDNALSIINQGLKLGDNSYLLFTKASIFYKQNKIDETIEALDYIINDVDTINEQAFLLQAKCYKKIKETAKAEETLITLNNINENNIQCKNELGILYREQKKYDKAIEWLLPLAEKGNILAQNELGILYRYWGSERYFMTNRERMDESKKWYLKALENDERNIQSYDGISKTLCFLKQFIDAEGWLLKGLSIRPNDFRLQQQLVNITFYNIRDIDRAEKYLYRIKNSPRTKWYIEKMEKKIKSTKT